MPGSEGLKLRGRPWYAPGIYRARNRAGLAERPLGFVVLVMSSGGGLIRYAAQTRFARSRRARGDGASRWNGKVRVDIACRARGL